MKKSLLVAAGAVLALQNISFAQRKCGIESVRDAIIAHDPAAAARFETQRQASKTAGASQATHKTTAVSAVPVIFHVILDSADLAKIGGVAGVKKRCDSQIAVINRDYNRQNGDSTLIPAAFKPVYAKVGIQYGLAHTAPNGHGTPGYEIKTITFGGFGGSDSSYARAKHASWGGGLDAWDETKYLNVWVIHFTDFNGLLGITTPRTFVGGGTGSYVFDLGDVGICISYDAFGKRSTTGDFFATNIDKGRTLTHELGHFWGLRHTWGDDGGLCPSDPSGSDDGFSDTPPEADAVYGSPALPKYDACSPSPGNGLMVMNYMDYTDDAAMQMFTLQQASSMNGYLSTNPDGNSLQTHPTLLLYPTAVANIAEESALQVYPNPTSAHVNVAVADNEQLNTISVINLMGQEVKTVNAQAGTNIYSIDLSGMSKGIYLVRCNFASGSVTRKILLQ